MSDIKDAIGPCTTNAADVKIGLLRKDMAGLDEQFDQLKSGCETAVQECIDACNQIGENTEKFLNQYARENRKMVIDCVETFAKNQNERYQQQLSKYVKNIETTYLGYVDLAEEQMNTKMDEVRKTSKTLKRLLTTMLILVSLGIVCFGVIYHAQNKYINHLEHRVVVLEQSAPSEKGEQANEYNGQ